MKDPKSSNKKRTKQYKFSPSFARKIYQTFHPPLKTDDPIDIMRCEPLLTRNIQYSMFEQLENLEGRIADYLISKFNVDPKIAKACLWDEEYGRDGKKLEAIIQRYEKEDDEKLEVLLDKRKAITTRLTYSVRIPLLKKVLHKMNFGIERSDAIASGTIGVMRAIQKCDYRKGFLLESYADLWIDQHIQRDMDEHSRVIRIPVHALEKLRGIHRTMTRNNITFEEAGKLRGLNDNSINELKEHQKIYWDLPSLNQRIGDEDDSEKGDLIEDTKIPNQHDQTDALQMHKAIQKSLQEFITPRQARILSMRFGLEGTKNYTLKELGELEGVTRERIRQIETSALKKLRENPEAIELLREFI